MRRLTNRFLDWAEKNPREASLLYYFVLGVVSGVMWGLFSKPTPEQELFVRGFACALLDIASSAVFRAMFVILLVLTGIVVATQWREKRLMIFLYVLLVLSVVAFISAPTWFHLIDDRWEYRPGHGAYCLVPKSQGPSEW